MEPERLPPSEDLLRRLEAIRSRPLDDDQLRAEIARVVDEHRHSEEDVRSWLQTLPGDAASAADVATHPNRIGPFRILEVLGEGGMGTVYRAEQDPPAKRQVALKLIKLGMNTRAVVARFEHERQALLLMEHDGIAKVHDCGTTESGQPYFVMELVRGIPLIDYCEQQRLPLRDRLLLVRQVCAAVQHAHQKGVVHRDLKPGNVLVSEEGGQVQVKVIDFGLAKVIGQELADAPRLTQAGHFIGTPEYVAPEQADPGNADIDTRADVYSLGVMLYEVLVGQLPFSGQELRRAGLLEMQRLLREVDPQKPSTKLLSSRDSSQAVAGARRMSVSALQRALKNDLDWVVLKALEKDRNRRYESPSALSADLARFLANEPLAAGPPSAVYRIKKFVRRHGRMVGTAVVVVVATVVVIVMSVQNALMKGQLDSSLMTTKLVMEKLQLQVEKDLSTATESLKRVPGTRETRRSMLARLVDTPDLAETPVIVEALMELGEIALETGDAGAASGYLDDAIARIETMASPPFVPLDVVAKRSLANLRRADLHRQQGEHAEAAMRYAQAESAAREAVSLPGAGASTSLHLAVVCEHSGNFVALRHGMDAAAKLFDESLRILVDIHDRHPNSDRWTSALLDGLFKQARRIHQAGDAAGSEAKYRQAVDLSEALHRAMPNDAERAQQHARNLRGLGDCILDLGRAAEALGLVHQARDIRLQVLAVDPVNAEACLGLAEDLFWCSQTNLALANLTEAEEDIREAESRLEKLRTLDPQNLDAARQMVQVRSALATIVWKVDGAAAAGEQLTRAALAADAVLAIVPDSVYDARTAAETWGFVAAIRASIDDVGGAAEAKQSARRVYLSGIERTKGATQRAFRIGLLSLDLDAALAAGVATDVDRVSLELLPLQREALAEAGGANKVFELFATLIYRARACLQLEHSELAFASFAEIRERCAPYRAGGTTLDLRQQYANALFEYQDALRVAGRAGEADGVAREVLEWLQALQQDGAEVGERILALEKLLGR